MSDCIHGMGRPEWCAICTPPAPAPEVPRPETVPSEAPHLVRKKPGTGAGHKPKPLAFRGTAAPQEVVVFEKTVD
jgi:hypothetical protein